MGRTGKDLTWYRQSCGESQKGNRVEPGSSREQTLWRGGVVTTKMTYQVTMLWQVSGEAGVVLDWAPCRSLRWVRVERGGRCWAGREYKELVGVWGQLAPKDEEVAQSR